MIALTRVTCMLYVTLTKAITITLICFCYVAVASWLTVMEYLFHRCQQKCFIVVFTMIFVQFSSKVTLRIITGFVLTRVTIRVSHVEDVLTLPVQQRSFCCFGRIHFAQFLVFCVLSFVDCFCFILVNFRVFAVSFRLMSLTIPLTSFASLLYVEGCKIYLD